MNINLKNRQVFTQTLYKDELGVAVKAAAEKFEKLNRSHDEWILPEMGDLGVSSTIDEQLAGGFSRQLEVVQLKQWEVLRKTLENTGTESIENLNLSLLSGVQYYTVAKESGTNPSHLKIEMKEFESFFSPRIIICVESGAKANIELWIHMEGPKILNSVVDIELGEGAEVHLLKVHELDGPSRCFSVSRVWQQASSSLQYTQISLGGNSNTDFVYALLDGPKANCTLSGLAVAGQGHNLDQGAFANHGSSQTTSHQNFRSLVGERGVSNFQGRIRVAEQSQQCEAHQLNKSIMLGKHCEANTRPQLEIFNDDVKCTHGATLGRLDPEEVFYMESRGIRRDIALQLLSHAFVEEILKPSRHLASKDRISKSIQRSIESLGGVHAN